MARDRSNAVRADEEEAFRQFVAAQLLPLRKLAYVTCGDWHLAEDAVATALAKLYPRWRRLDRPELYAKTMVYRAAIDERRRPWRRERSASDAMPDVTVRDPAPVSDDRLRVRAALLEVPPRQRARPRRQAARPAVPDQAAWRRRGTAPAQVASGSRS